EISSDNPYSFTVTEDLNITANFIKQNNDALLSDLTFSEGVLVPDFDPDINEYHLHLENKINFITIEAQTNHEKATIDGVGNIDISNADIIEIIVTAEDNDTQITYIINISKNTTDIKEPDTYFTNQFIYPNPTKEHLNIDLTYFTSEISLQIFTLSGEIVYDKTLKNGEIHKISLKNFSKGIHFVKMNNQITKIIIF
ncbi:T9SS type A sorting domain-containing protein, partial [Bacteroidales bacterium OttesenSCG-928-C19]|nr:T9SS type A sorting domain-containing protein [Bacteroidales bacterium OttesenSCG-928-C19]